MAFTAPDPATLKLRYPDFAAVDDAVIQYWLTDAERFVDTSWAEVDYAPALMALAAHNMAVAGLGSSSSAAVAEIRNMGVTRFKSGNMDATLSEDAVKAAVKGGYCSTRYGQEFALMQRRNFAGPHLAAFRHCAETCP